MPKPQIINITWHGKPAGYYVDVPDWNGGEVVSLEDIATYIESGCECLMEIVPGETKHAYGLRLLKTLAEEMRGFRRANKAKEEPKAVNPQTKHPNLSDTQGMLKYLDQLSTTYTVRVACSNCGAHGSIEVKKGTRKPGLTRCSSCECITAAPAFPKTFPRNTYQHHPLDLRKYPFR